MQFEIEELISQRSDIQNFIKKDLKVELKDDKLKIEVYDDVEPGDAIKDILCDISLFQLILRRTEESNNKEINSNKHL